MKIDARTQREHVRFTVWQGEHQRGCFRAGVGQRSDDAVDVFCVDLVDIEVCPGL